MHTQVSTEPGDPAIGNEDAVATGRDVVVVLDGVTPLDRSALPCRHGLDWFVRSLASALVDAASDPHRTLPDALSSSISTVADLHADGCDLADVDAPAATVAVVRQAADRLDYLVLADATVVLDLGVRILAVTDDRPARTGARLRAAGTPPTARMLRSGWANREGGYWVAAADPSAGAEALTGSLATAEVRRLVVATDGATRLVDTFKAFDWRTALDLIGAEGPAAWIARTRAAERASTSRRSKLHDDATLVLVEGETTAARRAAGPG